MVRCVLSAQMGKAGPPMNGKDLHVGDMQCGVLPASRRSAIGRSPWPGMAFAFARDGSGRVACPSSVKAARRSASGTRRSISAPCASCPAIFCVQNNQTALSTPGREQSAVRVFADKAAGYGIPGITIDGTDPDAIAAAFTGRWNARAADAARR